MVLTLAKIRRGLASIRLTTAHARIVKHNTICHLLTYQKSMMTNEVDLGALAAALRGVLWLDEHIRQIDDKQVLPSQRLFLADVVEFIFKTYETQKGV